MNREKLYMEDITKKIIFGVNLAFKKLVEEKRKNDEYIIFSRDGKIIKIKARDFVL